MQIHELNGYSGALDDAYMAVDNGSDTGKEKIKDITDPLNARIDNIIAGPASSAQEVIDARLGADGVTYPSLGDAIRDQFTDVKTDLNATEVLIPNLNILKANDAITGKGLNASGDEISHASLYVSDYINVNANATYIITSNANSLSYTHVWYDSSKNKLSVIPSKYNITGKTMAQSPSNAAFLRVTGAVSQLNADKVYLYDEIAKNVSEMYLKIPEINLLNPGLTVDGKGLDTNGDEVSYNILYISDYIKVVGNKQYDITANVNSVSWCHAWYNAEKSLISTIPSKYNNETYLRATAPENAAYLKVTGVLSHKEEDSVCLVNVESEQITQNTKDIQLCVDSIFPNNSIKVLGKTTLKAENETIDGYGYAAFSSGVAWKGKEYHVTRIGMSHATIEEETAGTVIFHVIDSNGKITVKEPNIDWSSLNYGEPRDPNLSITNNNHLLLSVTCTPDGTAESYTGLLFDLDDELNVMSYCVCSPTSFYFCWGNTLQTPDGYLLKTKYKSSADYLLLIRSTTPFTGDLSGMSFESGTVELHKWSLQKIATECTLGYYKNSLIALYRVNGNNSEIRMTSDLEGLTGWTGTAQTGGYDIGFQVHSPVLLQKCNDSLLLFGGSWMDEPDRPPVIGLIDIDNDCNVAVLQPFTSRYDSGGYPSLIRLDNTKFSSVFYAEFTESSTALYHRYFNIRWFEGFVDALDQSGNEITVKMMNDVIKYINARRINYNLFDINNVYKKRAIRTDGTIDTIPAAFITDFIEIAPGYKYSISQSLNSAVYANVFFDANKTVVGYTLSTGEAPIIAQAPATAKYIRATGLMANIDSFELLVNSQ